MKVTAIQCNHCKDIVYSRARHDMRWCSCGQSAIDGGRDYGRVVGDIEVFELDVGATEEELYNDWNRSRNKLGMIISKESQLKFHVAYSTAIETGESPKEIVKKMWNTKFKTGLAEDQ